MEKISVIAPVYNVAPYLKQCLDSIVNQTYRNLEIILVNDGSTDNSLEICQQYAKEDKRIRVISQKNAGVSAARNAGIDISNGKYLTFVDPDDWYVSPSSIADLYKLLKNMNADISIGNFNTYDEIKQTSYVHVFTDHFKQIGITPAEWFDNEYNSEEAISQCFSSSCGKIYQRNCFANIRFPVGKIIEDDLTMWKVYLSVQKIAYTNQPVTFYRENRPQSITKKASDIQMYPLALMEEKMSMEQSIHFSKIVKRDISAYMWRLQTHRNNALQEPSLFSLKHAQQSINIINKRNNWFY